MTHGRRNATAFAGGIAAGFSLITAACQEARAPDTPGFNTVASLSGDPERLDAVQEGCRTNQPWATASLCQTAADATRRRFRGDGVTYAPRAVDPFPTQPPAAPARPN